MKFNKPKKINNTTAAFAASVKTLMPSYVEIPDEFKDWNSSNSYVAWVGKWFFKGLSEDEIPAAKDGIDRDMALRHLYTILRSFEPKHEHKEAAVAYLASLWLEEPK